MSNYITRPNGKYQLAKSLAQSTLGNRQPARPVGSCSPLFDALMKLAQDTTQVKQSGGKVK